MVNEHELADMLGDGSATDSGDESGDGHWERLGERVRSELGIASLVVTSIIAAKAGHLVLRKVLLRSLVVGVGTMAVSYLAGLALF